jgi:hypothetical protein
MQRVTTASPAALNDPAFLAYCRGNFLQARNACLFYAREAAAIGDVVHEAVHLEDARWCDRKHAEHLHA